MQGTAFFVLRFSWPPASEVSLWRSEDPDGLVQVLATPFGRIEIQLSDQEGGFRWESQQISFDGMFVGIVVVRWDDKKISLRVNGREILSLADSRGEVAHLTGRETNPQTAPPALPQIKQLHSNNSDEEFFLRTLEDIQAKAELGQRYDLIRAAGLLRQLLCDAEPLIHRINRSRRIPLTFIVLADLGPLPVKAELVMQGIDPSDWPTSPTTSLSLSGFLRMPCLIGETNTATVSDIVLACANLMGGVHFGSKKDEGERFVLWLDQAISVGDATVVLAAIRGICRVTLKALAPLAHAVAC